MAQLVNILLGNFNYLCEISRNFWQNQYDSVVEIFGSNEFNLNVYATFLLAITVYWGAGTVYTLIDLFKPSFLYKYKIQENVEVTWGQIKPILKQILINQFVVSVPFAILGHYLKTYIATHDNSPKIPSIYRIIFDFTICSLLREPAFYYSHRFLHHPSVYKYIHKRHHEWTAPISFTAIYCHPLEHVVSNLLPVYLGPGILGSHRFTLWIWICYVTLLTLNDHSGYHFPFFLSPEFHDYHHLKFNQNYGINGVLDWFHGTDSKFRKTISFKRHKVLTCLKPIKVLIPNDYKTK